MTRVGQRVHCRHPCAQQYVGGHARYACGQEGQAPGVGVGEPCAEGHAEEVGHGHAGYHERHGLHFASGACEASRHDGADAEIGAVGQARHEAGADEGPVARRGRGAEVAYGYYGGEGGHDGVQRQAAYAQQGESAVAHARGVGRDEMAGLAHADAEAVGDVDEYAHHYEFGNAEGKCAERQGEQSFVHRLRYNLFYFMRSVMISGCDMSRPYCVVLRNTINPAEGRFCGAKV